MNHHKNKNSQKSMKNYRKKLLSLILCVALILGIQPTPRTIQAASHTSHNSITFTEWTDGTSLPASGNYYLGNSVELNTAVEITGTLNLCLNGQTISGSVSGGMIRVNGGTLNLYDCSGSGKVECPGENNPIQISEGGTLNLYGGTVTSGSKTAIPIGTGSVDTSNGCTLNVYGGKIIGGTNGIYVNENLSNPSVNIYGGEIQGENAINIKSGNITLSGGSITGTTCAVQAQNSATVTISGDATLNTSISTATSIIASGTGQSGLSKTYIIKYTGTTEEGKTVIVKGSTDKTHYQFDFSGYVPAANGTNLVAGKQYTVTFNKEGGEIANENNYKNYISGEGMTLPTPTKTEYTFGGWYENADCTGTKVTSLASTEIGNKTYWAKWTANKYTITFDGAVSGSKSAEYSYKQTGTISFPQAVDQSGSGKYFTGWKLTTSPATRPMVDGTVVNTSTIYQPGQALAFNGGASGNMTFTAQYTNVTGTSATSETLTITGKSTIPAPPAKVTYTVKVTGNDSIKMLTIGGVTVTRDGTEDFVLTTTGSDSKTVVIDGEDAGSVAANGTLTVTYKTLTVTVNANKAVTLQGGPELIRSGPVGGVYTYTHIARNPDSGAFPVLVDGADTGKTVRYGSTTALAYRTATATITAEPGATVSSVELVGGSKTLTMSASGSNQYTYTGLSDGTAYTLRVNGINVSGQTTNFSADKALSATIYAKTVTTKRNDETTDIPGVGDVKIGGLSAERTDVGTWLATQVGTSIGNTVSINGESVAATGGDANNDVLDYYTVTYDADNGGSAPADDNSYLKGTKATTLGQGEMAKDGCSFLGWKNDGTDVGVGETVTVSGQTILTARWEENASCEVRWQVPGGESQYGTLEEALDAAGTTPDVTITVQDGKTASLHTNHTLPESAKLIVPTGTKLVSDVDGAVLTVEGRIENAGSFDEPFGTLQIMESGKLINTGTVLWDIKPNAGKIDNTGGILGGEVENTDSGTVEGGTITGTVTGGTVTGPLTNEGTIKDATVIGQVDLPAGGEIIDSVVNGTVIDKGGDLVYNKELDGNGAVTPPGGSGTGSNPVQKLIDALGGAAVESPEGTVKLVADVNLTDNPLIIDDDVIIDLNGHTIMGPEDKPAIQIEGGDVTIKDSSDPDSGFIIGGNGGEAKPGAPGIENNGSGTITIEGGSVFGGSGGKDGDGGAGIKNSGNGNVVIKGGEVNGGTGGFGEPGGKGGSGIENTGNGKVNMEDGKVEGGSGGNGGNGGNGVTNAGDGTVNVSGGEVTGGTGGITGSGDGGEGGRGIDSDPDKATVDPDASVNAGEGGIGGDGTVTLRSVTPAIDAIPDQDYTGAEVTPAVVLRDGADIIPASEYVVEYRNNIYTGTATVIVKDRPNKENALYQLAEITTTFEIKGEPTVTPGPGTTAKPSAGPGTPTSGPGKTDKLSDKGKRKLEIHSKLKTSQTGKKLQISWGRVSGADGYSVYVQYCRKDFNAKSLNQVRSGKKTKITVKKVNGKKLDTKKNFKLYVVAWKWKNGKKSTLAKTLTIHVAGKDSVKYTNVKKIQLKKTSYTLKKGSTITLRPKAILYDRKKKQLSADHAKEFRYLSSNKKIATVTAGGKARAKGTGECTVYVFAKNGNKRKIKVKVKAK